MNRNFSEHDDDRKNTENISNSLKLNEIDFNHMHTNIFTKKFLSRLDEIRKKNPPSPEKYAEIEELRCVEHWKKKFNNKMKRKKTSFFL